MHTFEKLGITAETIRKFDQRIPRYTSYPTAPFWTEEFGPEAWTDHLRAHRGGDSALALYVHIPFCRKHCLFCACNVIITPKREVAEDYLGWLFREVELAADALQPRGETIQLHLGGGTPNYLTVDQLGRLVGTLERHFPFDPAAERSIEVDPRTASPEDVAAFRERLGFNRISFGTQDFHAETQEAIGRGQTREITFANVETARRCGYSSVNIDLIYGLPRQSAASWTETLDTVSELRPGRIALYNFAYLPGKLAHQRSLEGEALPDPALKLEMFIEAHNRLTTEGYVFIGMDHYALADDSLAVALREGTLRRNFMGYNTLRGTDMVSFGTSAISDLGGAFAQNHKKLSVYKRMIGEGVLPVERGLLLTAEDRERRFLIEEIMCNGRLKLDALPPRSREIIAEERRHLEALQEDGLLALTPTHLEITPKGRVFLRNIAVLFDEWLRKTRENHVFSRAV